MRIKSRHRKIALARDTLFLCAVIKAKSAKLREKRLAHNSYIRFFRERLAACGIIFRPLLMLLRNDRRRLVLHDEHRRSNSRRGTSSLRTATISAQEESPKDDLFL